MPWSTPAFGLTHVDEFALNLVPAHQNTNIEKPELNYEIVRSERVRQVCFSKRCTVHTRMLATAAHHPSVDQNRRTDLDLKDLVLENPLAVVAEEEAPILDPTMSPSARTMGVKVTARMRVLHLRKIICMVNTEVLSPVTVQLVSKVRKQIPKILHMSHHKRF